MRRFKRKFKKGKRKLLIVFILTLLLPVTIFVLDRANLVNIFPQKNTDSHENDDTKTTSTAPSAQSDFSDGDNRKPNNTTNKNKGSAFIEETANTSTSNNNPITSSTGEITVYSPNKDSIIKSGVILSGTSTLPKVEYRIIDSVSGVITTGSLAVKDGRFSGKITISTSANEGRIDVFAVRSDLTEYSHIEIPVKFKD